MQTIALVKTNWNKFFPGNTFEYFFLDDHFDEQYKADQRFGQVFGLFTLLAILVACLGLFGLASFTTIQRTKEIGDQESFGCFGTENIKIVIPGVCHIVDDRICYRCTVSMADHRKLVTRLCFSYQYTLVLFPDTICYYPDNCFVDSKLSINQSCNR